MYMDGNIQQIAERRFFTEFQNAYQLPEGSISFGDKPDVTLTGEKKIGIEITNFYVNSGKTSGGKKSYCEQSHRELRKQVILASQEKYFESPGAKNISLTISFATDLPNPKKTKLDERIVEFAHSLKDEPTGTVKRKFYDSIPEITFAYLLTDGYPGRIWEEKQCRHPGCMSLDRLSEIISTKEELAKQYQPCDAFWLLIVVHFWDSAQDQEINIDIPSGIGSEIFEKIFVFKTVFNHIVEIK